MSISFAPKTTISMLITLSQSFVSFHEKFSAHLCKNICSIDPKTERWPLRQMLWAYKNAQEKQRQQQDMDISFDKLILQSFSSIQEAWKSIWGFHMAADAVFLSEGATTLQFAMAVFAKYGLIPLPAHMAVVLLVLFEFCTSTLSFIKSPSSWLLAASGLTNGVEESLSGWLYYCANFSFTTIQTPPLLRTQYTKKLGWQKLFTYFLVPEHSCSRNTISHGLHSYALKRKEINNCFSANFS